MFRLPPSCRVLMNQDTRLTALFMVFSISLVTGLPAQAVSPEPPSITFEQPRTPAEARLQDLQMFEPFLELDVSYSEDAQAEARTILHDLRDRVADISDLEFLVELHRMVALTRNAHSEGRLGLFPRNFGSLPFRGYWFDGAYWVIRVKPGFEYLLGHRITHYDGRAIDEVNVRAMELSGGPLEFFRAVSGDAIMVTPAVLHHLDLVDRPDAIDVTLVAPTGKAHVRKLVASNPGRADNPSTASGRLLFPAFTGGGFGDWIHLPIAGHLPLYLSGDQPLEERFVYRRLGPAQVPYVILRGNASTETQSLPEFIQAVDADLGSERHRRIIVDMRLNQGGNMLLTQEFMRTLPDRLTPDGRIYAVIGHRTFSAGMIGVAMLKHAGGDRVVLIGEHVGDRPRFWSEGRRYALPNSEMRVTYSLGMHDLLAGCGSDPRCYPWYATNVDPVIGSFGPDIHVPTSFADYVAGRDPVLARIEALEGIRLRE